VLKSILPLGQTNGLATRFINGKTAPKPIDIAVMPINQHQINVHRRVLVWSFITINSPSIKV
jgi:hypothetical protein